MDTADIQKRVDAMPAAMAEKGLKKPEARFSVVGNEGLKGMFAWEERKGGFSMQFHHHKGDTPEEVLASMDSWIAALPSRDEANLRGFMTALGDVIEIGRQNGIEVDFVNPLVETMKRLSENAITHQAAAE